MEVILKSNVDGLGKEGELLKVSDGYARNYLLPKQIAVVATDKGRRLLEHEKRVDEQKVAKEERTAAQIAEKISEGSLRCEMLAGENDRLFGSVTSADLASSLKEMGIEIDRRSIRLEEPIKELGLFLVPIRLHKNLTIDLKVIVARKEE